MGSPLDHEFRAREIADSLRNFLLTVNSGAIAVIFTVAGMLFNKEIGISWTFIPTGFFVIGLICCAGSMFLAHHRELKRRDSAELHQAKPKFSWYQKSVTWNALSFLCFVGGVIAAFISLKFFGAGI